LVRLLLDTNILIPLFDPDVQPLQHSLLKLLSDESNHLFASVASLWEIVIKMRLGKLRLGLQPEQLPAALERVECHLLDVAAGHALAEAQPWPETKDPFDRLLLSVCAFENLLLVTKDEALLAHPLAWRPASA
jgi:PIN domain nuclease of toxin-antitoxin system